MDNPIAAGLSSTAFLSRGSLPDEDRSPFISLHVVTTSQDNAILCVQSKGD